MAGRRCTARYTGACNASRGDCQVRALIFSLILAVPVAVLAYLLFWPAVRRWRRRRLRARPPPADLDAVLARNISLYAFLPDDLRQQLHGHVNVFLAEKKFIGAGGQEIAGRLCRDNANTHLDKAIAR